MSVKNSKKLWLAEMSILCLLSLALGLAGCFGKKEIVVLRDSEVVTAHPTDPNKVCMDEGYLLKIFEELER